MQNQGTQLQGILLQGTQVQGMTMQGFQFAGATLNGAALANVRIENGELVAEQNQVTLRGGAARHAHLLRRGPEHHRQSPDVRGRRVPDHRHRGGVRATIRRRPASTFLYTLEQNVDNTGS